MGDGIGVAIRLAPRAKFDRLLGIAAAADGGRALKVAVTAPARDGRANEALLRQVAEFTGGRFQPDPKSVFDAGRRSIASSMQLWPGLLALAVALNLAELVMRKWKGVMGRK